MIFSFFRKLLFAAAFLRIICGTPLPGQQTNLDTANDLRDKNYYVLSLFEADRAAQSALSNDKSIYAVQGERLGKQQIALATCKDDVACELKSVLWTDDEIARIAAALKNDYKTSAALQNISDKLRQSMAYQLFAEQDGPTLLANAWILCARGLNKVVSVYGLGEAPLYPHIDSISFEVSSGTYQQLVHSTVLNGLLSNESSPSFFSASVRTAIRLMILNHRDEAIRFEPLAKTVNASALQSLHAIEWKSRAYSIILVPGEGPADAATSLSALGRRRVALAAQAFQQGLAPLIMVSGGFVHPSQTRFAEASEMKLALMRDFGIPESAILVEPFARHTTTNLRNAAREVFSYKIPFYLPMLVVSDVAQIQYIASTQMAVRCKEELGYMPFTQLMPISNTQLSVMPNITSLQQNPLDPLDP